MLHQILGGIAFLIIFCGAMLILGVFIGGILTIYGEDKMGGGEPPPPLH